MTCDIGSLPGGGTATITITVSVDAAVAEGTIITNTAQVAGDQADPDLANDEATEQTEVVVQADLILTKTDWPDPVLAGNTVTYTLTVQNNGPLDATGVLLTDTLPAETSFAWASVGCIGVGYTVTCDIGDVPSGSSDTVTIAAKVADSTAPGTDLTNSATVTGDQPDPEPADNTATAITTVSAPPPVPSLSQWGLIALASMLLVVFAWRIGIVARRKVA